VPAWAFFAARASRDRRLAALPVLRWPLASGPWPARLAGLFGAGPYVRGYADRRAYVVEHTTASPTCLFDSYLNGNFIYQVRLRDPGRRLWVLRGDKVFYSVRSDPHAGLAEYAHTKEDVLALSTSTTRSTSSWRNRRSLPLATPTCCLRCCTTTPTGFRPFTTSRSRRTKPSYRGHRLVIYHNLVRNPAGPASIEIDVAGHEPQGGDEPAAPGGP